MRFNVHMHGIHFEFETHPSLFSPNGVDRGSAFLLSLVEFDPADKVLDLGCGYGLMGIYAAKPAQPEYRNKLTHIFGGLRVFTQDSYFVFQAFKKSASYANRSPRVRSTISFMSEVPAGDVTAPRWGRHRYRSSSTAAPVGAWEHGSSLGRP